MKTLTVKQKIVGSIVAAMLLIYGTQGTGYGQEQNNVPEFTPVSERTPQVRDTIVALVPGVDSANDVTASHLALITNLNLSEQSITTLKAGDFDGLSALRWLSLAKNTLIRVGIHGTFIPDADIAAQLGGEFSCSYETPSYAVGGEFRLSGSTEYEPGSDSLFFHSFSIGGRYFFNKQNISPYIT